MIKIPVVELETDGKTIWIHSAKGATVLRIKCMKGISLDVCQHNAVSHCDLIVEAEANICLHEDDVKDNDLQQIDISQWNQMVKKRRNK